MECRKNDCLSGYLRTEWKLFYPQFKSNFGILNWKTLNTFLNRKNLAVKYQQYMAVMTSRNLILISSNRPALLYCACSTYDYENFGYHEAYLRHLTSEGLTEAVTAKLLVLGNAASMLRWEEFFNILLLQLCSQCSRQHFLERTRSRTLHLCDTSLGKVLPASFIRQIFIQIWSSHSSCIHNLRKMVTSYPIGSDIVKN